MSVLENTVNRAIADFDSIENAIEDMGVDVPQGTNTNQYGNLIRQISGDVTDVKVDGESVVTDKVAEIDLSDKIEGAKIDGESSDLTVTNKKVIIPKADEDNYGVVKLYDEINSYADGAPTSRIFYDVFTGLDVLKESVLNKQTTVVENNDVFYPTCKAVADYVNQKLQDGQYELIETINCDGTTDVYEREITPNGKAYDFKKVFIEVNAKASNVSNYDAFIYVNNITSSYAYLRNFIQTTARIGMINLDVSHGILDGTTRFSAKQGDIVTVSGIIGTQEVSSIYKIKFRSPALPADSTIKIYAIWK